MTDGRLPAGFLVPGSSSFVDFLTRHEPSLLPTVSGDVPVETPHATTVLALTYRGGVAMAGDRRATIGSMIASAQMEKVFPADDHSAIGIAGTAGIGLDLVRLFQLELEHFEKIEGTSLSLRGKAIRLGTMIRANLPMAMRGLGAIPLFAGYDTVDKQGRIYSYDATGGRYEEHDFHALGSGSVFARGSLKKLWTPDLTADGAVRVAMEVLLDTAEDDAGTGGPDQIRAIFPVTRSAGSKPTAETISAGHALRPRLLQETTLPARREDGSQRHTVTGKVQAKLLPHGTAVDGELKGNTGKCIFHTNLSANTC